MLIVADAEIPRVAEHFGDLGEVRLLGGRAIDAPSVRDADLLLVRSITRVDGNLLRDARVRFVGTATAGTDHLDIPWLQAHGIGFADAGGCNADAVADWILCGLALSLQDGILAEGDAVAVVGWGRIGSRVGKRMTALGLKPLAFDPPLAALHASAGHKPTGSFANIFPQPPLLTQPSELRDARALTLHIPLTHEGPFPTLGLVDEALLVAMPELRLYCNSSRGDVAKEQVLLRLRRRGPLQRLLLDVWNGEPRIAPEMVTAAWLASPHVAGHSRLGKERGTSMLRDAYDCWCGLERPPRQVQSKPELIATIGTHPADWLVATLDPWRLDRLLRESLSEKDPAASFDRLRRGEGHRLEVSEAKLPAEACPTEVLRAQALGLGFRVQADPQLQPPQP